MERYHVCHANGPSNSESTPKQPEGHVIFLHSRLRIIKRLNRLTITQRFVDPAVLVMTTFRVVQNVATRQTPHCLDCKHITSSLSKHLPGKDGHLLAQGFVDTEHSKFSMVEMLHGRAVSQTRAALIHPLPS